MCYFIVVAGHLLTHVGLPIPPPLVHSTAGQISLDRVVTSHVPASSINAHPALKMSALGPPLLLLLILLTVQECAIALLTSLPGTRGTSNLSSTIDIPNTVVGTVEGRFGLVPLFQLHVPPLQKYLQVVQQYLPHYQY